MSRKREGWAKVPARRTWPPLPVLLEAGDKSGCGLVLNLSESTAFVATSLILRPKSRLRLLLSSGGPGQLKELEAEVVWHNHRFFPVFKQLPTGYGIRFAEDDSQRQLLGALLRGVNPSQSVA